MTHFGFLASLLRSGGVPVEPSRGAVAAGAQANVDRPGCRGKNHTVVASQAALRRIAPIFNRLLEAANHGETNGGDPRR